MEIQVRSCFGCYKNSESLELQQQTTMLLFAQFVASFNNESPREELLFGLSELHESAFQEAIH